jgi:broad specificity phosphatase PhoE
MSTLYLIRHGQAGFGQADYDVLSPLGESQTAQLGSYCAAAKLRIGSLYCAPRRRHRDSTHHLRRAASSAGWPLPEPQAAAAFDEFGFAEILTAACQGELAADYARLRAELGGNDPLRDGRSFNHLFRQAMSQWVSGQLQTSESFAQFTARVESGLREVLVAAGSGSPVAIVTSAGAISAVLMQTLELSPAHMIKLCLSLWNSGLSELRYRHGELSVVTVNAIPHLLRPEDRTFR